LRLYLICAGAVAAFRCGLFFLHFGVACLLNERTLSLIVDDRRERQSAQVGRAADPLSKNAADLSLDAAVLIAG
jgi:hypothetical protein